MVKNQESKIPQFYDILDEELDKTNEIFDIIYKSAKANGFINIETTKFELQKRYLNATKVSSTYPILLINLASSTNLNFKGLSGAFSDTSLASLP